MLISEKAYGQDDPVFIYGLSMFAFSLETRGEYDRAEALYKKVIRIREKKYGPCHGRVALAYNALAGMNVAAGRYSEAEKQFRRQLEIFETLYGRQGTQVAFALHGLWYLFEKQDRYDEAEPFLVEALALCKDDCGTKCSCYQKYERDLKELYSKMGKTEDAQKPE